MKTPSGDALTLANLLGALCFMEEQQEEDASPQYHDYAAHMLNMQGSPATAGAGDYGGDNEASCQPGHPITPKEQSLTDQCHT